jgi:cardiolipin synthase
MMTISNLLSSSRFVLVLPSIFFLWTQQTSLLLITIAIAALTDIFDGYFARSRNEITEIGKIIDPLADKVYVGAMTIGLYVFGNIPLWFFVAILGRDALILLGSYIVTKKTKKTLMSNYIGKGTVILISITLIVSLFQTYSIAATVGMYLQLLSLLAMLISLMSYGKASYSVLSNYNKPNE